MELALNVRCTLRSPDVSGTCFSTEYTTECRVNLTRLRLQNIITHFLWNNDPELNHYDSEAPFHPEKFEPFRKRFLKLIYHPAPDVLDLEIHTHDGHLIGVAFIEDINLTHRHCKVGLSICEPAFLGQGYGRDTLAALVNYAFHGLGMNRVAADVFDFNEAWRGLLESMGFCYEGRLKDYLVRNGMFVDKEIYAMLAAAHHTGLGDTRDLALVA